ncbi:MAG: nuclear transport factor 2 family protein [Phycisphaeraceae bacterium]
MLASVGEQIGWVPYLLFESPGWLMAGFAIVWAAMRVIGRRTQNPRLLRVSWCFLAGVALTAAAGHFVTTDRERLETALTDLLLAVEDNDLARVRALIDPDATTRFMAKELDRNDVIERIDDATIDDIKLLSKAVLLDNEPGFGTTAIRVNAKGSFADFPGTQVSEWAIRWRLEDDRWRAVRFECVAIGADAIFGRSDE